MHSLATVVGHRRQTTLLSEAISRETLPQTLLFAGPSGVGKYSVARVVSAVLNCLSPVKSAEGIVLDACGACRACDRITRSVHVDVLALEPDDRASIKIDVVREVLSRTAFRPFEGRRRVVIIREADTLEVAAQNALLKSLEEPPPATAFILATAVPGALLPTVRSRAMRLRFGRLAEADIQTILTRDHGRSPREARDAAALADGSVGQALSLGSVDLEVVRETAVALLQQTAANRAVAAKLQAAGLLATTPSKKERTREDLSLVLRFAASLLRDIELLNANGDARVLANPGLVDELQALKRPFAGDRGRQAFAAVDRAIAALSRNAGIKVVSEWLAVQI